jgi:uncharacterized protein
MAMRDPHLIATRIIQDAGGELVGRTRLQKVGYLLQLAGFCDELAFEYRQYGPFSEDLSRGMEIAAAFGDVDEAERQASWGGRYSIYSVRNPARPDDPRRAKFVQEAKRIGAIELELAATAAYLFQAEGIGRTREGNPWVETRCRKPSKSDDGRLEQAAVAYEKLRTSVDTPRPLPRLPPPDGIGGKPTPAVRETTMPLTHNT